MAHYTYIKLQGAAELAVFQGISYIATQTLVHNENFRQQTSVSSHSRAHVEICSLTNQLSCSLFFFFRCEVCSKNVVQGSLDLSQNKGE